MFAALAAALNSTPDRYTIVRQIENTKGIAKNNAIDDALVEGDETVIIDISTVTNGTESGVQQQTITINDDETLGVTNFDINNFKYFPNPVEDILTISYNKNIESIAVYNLTGQEIMIQKVNSDNAKLDFSSFSTGTYLMNVFVEDGSSKTIKVIRK